MRLIKILILLLLVSSCDIQKRNIKNKEDRTDQKEITTTNKKVTEEIREGGSITTDIIPIEQRERDDDGNIKELIQTLKDGGLTKTIYYKPDGGVRVDTDCDDIVKRTTEDFEQKYSQLLEEYIKQKDKDKEENFDSSVILYGFLGIGLLILIVGFFGVRYLKGTL